MKMYFLAILTPSEVDQEIKAIKLEMKARYGSKNALKLPAHITLAAPFFVDDKDVLKLKEALTSVAQESRSFEAELSDFDCFAPRVLYVKVSPHRPLQELHQRIQPLIHIFSLKGKSRKKSPFHPHITIASRDLSKKDFNPAWNELQSRSLKRSFHVNELCLLHHNGKTWDLDSKYSLET